MDYTKEEKQEIIEKFDAFIKEFNAISTEYFATYKNSKPFRRGLSIAGDVWIEFDDEARIYSFNSMFDKDEMVWKVNYRKSPYILSQFFQPNYMYMESLVESKADTLNRLNKLLNSEE